MSYLKFFGKESFFVLDRNDVSIKNVDFQDSWEGFPKTRFLGPDSTFFLRLLWWKNSLLKICYKNNFDSNKFVEIFTTRINNVFYPKFFKFGLFLSTPTNFVSFIPKIFNFWDEWNKVCGSGRIKLTDRI